MSVRNWITSTRGVLLLAAGILGVVMAWIAFVPISAQVYQVTGDATIRYRLDTRFVRNLPECVIYSWVVTGTQAVEFNGEGRIGEASEEYCFTGMEAPPMLLVKFINGEQQEYVLPITVLSRAWWYWVLGGAIVGILMATALPTGVNRVIWRVAETMAIWIVIMLVLLEGGFRLWIGVTGSSRERLLYFGSALEIREANRYHPQLFTLYGLTPLDNDVNQMGFRGPEIMLEKPASVFRIATLGGSTTYGSGVAWDEAWPVQLERLLNDQYGYSVEVVNAGVPNYYSLHSLVNYQTRVRELDPDLIIVYHGFNDAYNRFTSQDCLRGNNINIGLGLLPYPEAQTPTLSPSAFWRFTSIRLGWIEDPSIINRDNIETLTPVDCDPSGEAGDPVPYFERNMNYLIISAQGDDVDVMLSTFVMGVEDFNDPNLFPQLPQTLPINDVTRTLAQIHNTYFYDLFADFGYNPEHWQSDAVHKTPIGHLAQAEHFARYLDEMEVISESE